MRNKKREFFEIKTRAVLPIRQDVGGYKNWLDYKIDRVKGGLNSYEREFFDMIRNSFLKYSLQIRLGRMKGAFFSYHNTVQVCMHRDTQRERNWPSVSLRFRSSEWLT